MFIIAHRGAPHLCIENTIQSFITALEYNVSGIELDVQYSKDKQLIVFHDWDLSRFTGESTRIIDSDYNFLRTINLNTNKDHFVGIPLFEDIAAIMPDDKYFHVEIKSKSIVGHRLFVKDIICVIKKYHLEKKTIISSFNPFVLRWAKKLAPEIKRGVLWTKKTDKSWYIRKWNILFIQPYSFHIDIQFISTKLLSLLKKRNIKTYLYTINNQDQYKMAKQYGVDGIFSNIPNLED